ncbi:MAG: FHIPEP family type III secretion protein, partial [Pseudomonadota bacterium]
LVPGLPFVPFILGASILAIAAVLAGRIEDPVLREAAPTEEVAKPAKRSLGDLMDVDEIHVKFSPSLVPAVMEPGAGLESRIINMRRHLVTEFGFIIPEVRLTDDALLPSDCYKIQIQGVDVASSVLRPGKLLILTNADVDLDVAGEDVQEPVYGAPARWIREADHELAAELGLPVIAPGEVVATHLLETLRGNFGRLLTRRALRKLLDNFVATSDPDRATANRKLLDEFVPDKVPVDVLQNVLRMLLDERVSIRNLPLILEAIADARTANASLDDTCEHVRRRIAFHIVSTLSEPDGSLPLIQLAPEWEAKFAEHERVENGVADIALPPDEFNRLAGSVKGAIARTATRAPNPAIATSARRRRFVRDVLEAKGISNSVLSFEEIGNTTKLSLLGTA